MPALFLRLESPLFTTIVPLGKGTAIFGQVNSRSTCTRGHSVYLILLFVATANYLLIKELPRVMAT